MTCRLVANVVRPDDALLAGVSRLNSLAHLSLIAGALADARMCPTLLAGADFFNLLK